MFEQVFLWNVQRLVRKPGHFLVLLTGSLVVSWMTLFFQVFPGGAGVVIVCAMALGFASPCVGSVATEGRYLLTRATSRSACLAAWVLFAIAALAIARVSTTLLAPRGDIETVVMLPDARIESMLAARGLPGKVMHMAEGDVVSYLLPGYGSFCSIVLLLSVVIGLFMRLCDVSSSARGGVSRGLHGALRAKAPAAALVVFWLAFVHQGRGTYLTMWSYLHHAEIFAIFTFAAAVTAAQSWHAWNRGDV